MSVASIPEVAEVVELAGPAAGSAPPRLLVEVPHGADRRTHFDALAARLRSDLPRGLVDFFHANTDEGAWELGLAAAHAAVLACPTLRVRLIRCLVPRTFIDCNRVLDGDPAAHGGGVTAGLPVYVDHPADQRLLRELHGQYAELVDVACAEVVGEDGLVLVPHTYAPRTVGIAAVERDIVEKMHWAWHPDRVHDWPLRPEVDLITRDAGGRCLAPPGLVPAVQAGLGALGLTVEEGGTYWLHPATRAAELSARHPERLFCLEVRRDVLMPDWQPFLECHPADSAVASIGGVLGRCVTGALPSKSPTA